MKRKPGETIPELASTVEYDKMQLHVIFNPLKIF